MPWVGVSHFLSASHTRVRLQNSMKRTSRFPFSLCKHHALLLSFCTAIQARRVSYSGSARVSTGVNATVGKRLCGFARPPYCVWQGPKAKCARFPPNVFSSTTTPPPSNAKPKTRPRGVKFKVIQVKILSNWGNPDYTCLYRLRVHGRESN